MRMRRLNSQTSVGLLLSLGFVLWTNSAVSSSWSNDAGPRKEGWRQNAYATDRREYDAINDDGRSEKVPPPPPPPRPNFVSTPIHYEFRVPRDEATNNRSFDKGADDLPVTGDPPLQTPDRHGDIPRSASARTDVITTYMSSTRGRLQLQASAGLVGAAMGNFVGRSLHLPPRFLSTTVAILFVLATLLRDAYGEWVKALAMTFILTIQRSRQVRRHYPTYRHIQSSLGMRERQRFPPAPNPWNYRPRDDRDVEFSMLLTVLSMAFVGAVCGGNIPLVPTWMGALAFGSSLAFAATLPSARGDLARAVGMRVVALCQLVWDINEELGVLNKTAVVSGKVLDKVLILDRKHRIKDRIVSVVTFLYEQAKRAANQAQGQSQPQDAGRDLREREDRRSFDRDARNGEELERGSSRGDQDDWRRQRPDGRNDDLLERIPRR